MAETASEPARSFDWTDIGYFAVATPEGHRVDFKVYQAVRWDRGAEPGIMFSRWDGPSTDHVDGVEAADVFLSGKVKWDGCCDLRFDEQEACMLHFCGKRSAMNVGVLLGRLYEATKAMLPAELAGDYLD
jgi:hypothetical protein